MMAPLFAPPDVDEQHEIWGANCGPCALAALLGKKVADVRWLVESAQGGAFLGYMNAGHLEAALRGAGLTAMRQNNGVRGRVIWPQRRGLVVIQIDGPWCEMGVNPRARYRYTHTIAFDHALGQIPMVYDCNADTWQIREAWHHDIMAMLVAEQKRATGWYTSSVIEVSR